MVLNELVIDWGGEPLDRQDKEYIAVHLWGNILGPEYLKLGRRDYRMSRPRMIWLEAVANDIRRAVKQGLSSYD